MGGGMGGMGGMGGFRSVPTAIGASATLRPDQSRELPTALVSLNGPSDDNQVNLPARGEPLELGDASTLINNPSVLVALKHLAEERAPMTVAQLVMWRLGGLDWSTIARLSKRWSNASELALARSFVDRLAKAQGELPVAESARIYWDIDAAGAKDAELAAQLKKQLSDKVVLRDEKGKALGEYDVTVLGLVPALGTPIKAEGPALSCQVRLEGDEATVKVAAAEDGKWQPKSKFTLPLTRADGARMKPHEVLDAAAEGIVGRLVRVQLVKEKGRDRGGKPIYRIKIDNNTPLILNGLALTGSKLDDRQPLSAMAGLSLPPRKNLSLPASADVVERLGLKEGVRLLAADLSGL